MINNSVAERVVSTPDPKVTKSGLKLSKSSFVKRAHGTFIKILVKL